MAGRPVESRHGAEVRLVGLSRNYGEVAAVRAVDLTIAPGEFVTLLGPSGSGKTTTLMMVAGFVHPTAGDILLDGRSVLAVAATAGTSASSSRATRSSPTCPCSSTWPS